MNLLVQIALITSILNFVSGLNCYGCLEKPDLLSCGKEYVRCTPDTEFCAKIMTDPVKIISVAHACAKRATSDHLGRAPGCYDGKALHAIPFFDHLETKIPHGFIEFNLVCICNTDDCNGSGLLKSNVLIFLGFVGFLAIFYKPI